MWYIFRKPDESTRKKGLDFYLEKQGKGSGGSDVGSG